MKKVCKCCYNEYDVDDFDLSIEPAVRMIDKGLCFTCAHWDHNFELDHSDERLSRGIPVIIGDPDKRSNKRYHWFLPLYLSGGSSNTSIHPVDRFQPSYKILMKDGRLYTVNNLWHQGEIPPVWYDKFEVNAIFISNTEALSLIARIDTKISEDLTHYIISANSMIDFICHHIKEASDV